MGDNSRRLAGLRKNLHRRAVIVDIIRAFFKERDFLEVETPVRVPAIAPEPYILPFRSEGWFLSTSPELHMKRLLAAGYERLFQFSRCFRRGERGRLHNPEFTMLEWYRAGADYNDILGDIEELLATLLEKLRLNKTIEYRGIKIDIEPPWPRVAVSEAYVRSAGWDPVAVFDSLRFDTDFVTKVLPALAPDRPTILTDYPAALASLARLKPGDSGVAERAEVFIGGLELANAYSELVDAAEQERRFREAIEQIRRENRQPPPVSREFLEAVRLLPPCGGVALGIDRLVMLLCDAASIDEVMAFTVDTA
ncbi:MAG: EF-P lysine aminoacylase GenX [Chloroflexi bacterium RBG_16_56_11]|nr:MAG: EF-P lysine aminoacylase GenX [Chloroflexi bacterium RBG_16_56_11]